MRVWCYDCLLWIFKLATSGLQQTNNKLSTRRNSMHWQFARKQIDFINDLRRLQTLTLLRVSVLVCWQWQTTRTLLLLVRLLVWTDSFFSSTRILSVWTPLRANICQALFRDLRTTSAIENRFKIAHKLKTSWNRKWIELILNGEELPSNIQVELRANLYSCATWI